MDKELCEALRVKLDRMKSECDKLATQLGTREETHALLLKKYQLLKQELHEGVRNRSSSSGLGFIVCFFSKNLVTGVSRKLPVDAPAATQQGSGLSFSKIGFRLILTDQNSKWVGDGLTNGANIVGLSWTGELHFYQ